MKRKLSFSVIGIALSFCLIVGCAFTSNETRPEYGQLKSAVEASAYAVIGEYGDSIPPDFDSLKFIQVINGNIPKQFFDTIKKYPITVKSKGTYYLLTVMSPDKKVMLLFDFSCTPEVDGPVYLNPGKYDTNNLDQYDPCKNVHELNTSISQNRHYKLLKRILNLRS